MKEHDAAWYNCTCAECGTKFHKTPNKLARDKVHYCSNACRCKKEGKAMPKKRKENAAPEPLCELRKNCNYDFSDCERCHNCGFYFPEMERRLGLPLVIGENGLWHMNIAKGASR